MRKWIYILQYLPKINPNAVPARIIFKENIDGNETLIWVTNPTGRKELVTKKSARQRWDELIKQGWYRVDK